MTWQLCGGTANDDYADTDGYYIVAVQYFTTTLAGTASSKAGSCVQYVKYDNEIPDDEDTAYGAPAVCHFINWSTTAGTTDSTTATELTTMTTTMFNYGWAPTATFSSYGSTVSAATYGVTFWPENGTGRAVTMNADSTEADF